MASFTNGMVNLVRLIVKIIISILTSSIIIVDREVVITIMLTLKIASYPHILTIL